MKPGNNVVQHTNSVFSHSQVPHSDIRRKASPNPGDDTAILAGLMALSAVVSIVIFTLVIVSGPQLERQLLIILTGLCLLLVMWDATLFRLPDFLTLPLLAGGLVYGFFAAHGGGMIGTLTGVAVGAGLPFMVRLIHQKVRGSEGLGLGDVKFLGAAGAWTGVLAVPWVIVFGAVAALVWCAISIGLLNKRPARLPFGVFLSPALLLVVLGVAGGGLW